MLVYAPGRPGDVLEVSEGGEMGGLRFREGLPRLLRPLPRPFPPRISVVPPRATANAQAALYAEEPDTTALQPIGFCSIIRHVCSILRKIVLLVPALWQIAAMRECVIGSMFIDSCMCFS